MCSDRGFFRSEISRAMVITGGERALRDMSTKVIGPEDLENLLDLAVSERVGTREWLCVCDPGFHA